MLYKVTKKPSGKFMVEEIQDICGFFSSKSDAVKSKLKELDGKKVFFLDEINKLNKEIEELEKLL